MSYDHLPRSRAEAKASGATHYFTGSPCIRRHVAPRETKGSCTACRKEDNARDAEKRKEYFKTSLVVKEVKRRYYERNKELVKARANLIPIEQKRQYRKAWKERNPELKKADVSQYRRRHRMATPRWLTDEQRLQIQQIYLSAMAQTRASGARFVVDHIVPLRSDVVCGLHVPWNLQILEHAENSRKSNRLIDTPASQE